MSLQLYLDEVNFLRSMRTSHEGLVRYEKTNLTPDIIKTLIERVENDLRLESLCIAQEPLVPYVTQHATVLTNAQKELMKLK